MERVFLITNFGESNNSPDESFEVQKVDAFGQTIGSESFGAADQAVEVDGESVPAKVIELAKQLDIGASMYVDENAIPTYPGNATSTSPIVPDLFFVRRLPGDRPTKPIEIQLVNEIGQTQAAITLVGNEERVHVSGFSIPRVVIEAALAQEKGTGEFVGPDGQPRLP